jgi:hypothetical protein
MGARPRPALLYDFTGGRGVVGSGVAVRGLAAGRCRNGKRGRRAERV